MTYKSNSWDRRMENRGIRKEGNKLKLNKNGLVVAQL